MTVRGYAIESCLPLLKRFLFNENQQTPTFLICPVVNVTQVGAGGGGAHRVNQWKKLRSQFPSPTHRNDGNKVRLHSGDVTAGGKRGDAELVN